MRSEVIKQRIWMARSAVECPCVVTTAFYSQAQWCLCAAEPSWPSRKPQSSLRSPTSSETQTSTHRPPFYFGIYTGNCLYAIYQISPRNRHICIPVWEYAANLLTKLYNSINSKSALKVLYVIKHYVHKQTYNNIMIWI